MSADIVSLLRALARCEHGDLSVSDEAADEIERLSKENFSLAAGQCIHDDGISGDERGTPFCRIAKERDRLRVANGLRDQQIASLREQLRRARALLESWDLLDAKECEGPDGMAVMIDIYDWDDARDGLDEFLHPPIGQDSET